MTDSPISDPRTRLDAGRLGMVLFLLSLGMVFGATIIAYVVVRQQLMAENDWKPDDSPGLPWLPFRLHLRSLLLFPAKSREP